MCVCFGGSASMTRSPQSWTQSLKPSSEKKSSGFGHSNLASDIRPSPRRHSYFPSVFRQSKLHTSPPTATVIPVDSVQVSTLARTTTRAARNYILYQPRRRKGAIRRLSTKEALLHEVLINLLAVDIALSILKLHLIVRLEGVSPRPVLQLFV